MSIGANPSYSAVSNFPGGFKNGVVIKNLPVLGIHGGRVFWVDSVNGSDGNKGTYARPFATINYAVTQMAVGATNNDIVICKDGHAETVTTAAGITLSQAGMTLMGLGNGRRRPTITFTTATTATMKITAANVAIQGFRFVNGIASLATMLDIVGTDVTVDNCEFYEGSATTGLTFIDFISATANQCDGLTVSNSRFINPTAGNYTAGIKMDIVHDRVSIVGNYFYMQASLSCLHNITGKVMTNLTIANNYLENLTAATSSCNLISACTGTAYGNTFLAGSNTAAGMVPGSMVLTGGNFDNLGSMDVGSTIMVKRTITSSAILTASATTFLTATGELAIDNIIVKSDATGLAGGTNFQILTNNAKGLANILVETVANLGTNKTIDLNNASVTKIRSSIETTKALQVQSTVGACTGSGTIDIIVAARRVTAGAVLI